MTPTDEAGQSLQNPLTAASLTAGIPCPLHPRRGDHSTEEAHHDKCSETQRKSSPGVHRHRKLVPPWHQPQRPLYGRAKYVADEGGPYWLLDAIAIAQQFEKSVVAEEFQVWKLTVCEDRTASLVCDDGNDNIVYSQHNEYTDFPIDMITFYFTDNTILLPSEY